MSENIKDTPLNQLRLSRIIFPILFSLSVAGFMIYRSYNPKILQELHINGSIWIWLIVCFGCMALRDLGYIWRMHLLGTGELNWRSSFETTLLWEFCNTVAPSLTGGTPLVIYFLIKEKLNGGKSTAIVFLTILFDQMFFVVSAPIMILWVGWDNIAASFSQNAGGAALTGTFWTAYCILAAYNSLLFFGIFINPNAVKSLIIWVFNFRLFKRWQHIGESVGNDVLLAANTYKGKPFSYWIKMIVSTVFAWGARFLVANCLLMAFSPLPITWQVHKLLFARQSILFVIMFMAVTPGGSGIAESAFEYILGSLCPIPPGKAALAFLWRMIGFYPYMLLGVWLLPRWINRVFAEVKEG